MILDINANPIIDGAPVMISCPGKGGIVRTVSVGGVCRFSADREDLPGPFIISVNGERDTLFYKEPYVEEDNTLRITDSRTGDNVPFPVAVIPQGGEYLRGDADGIIEPGDSIPETGIIVLGGGYQPEVIHGTCYGEEALPAEVSMEPLGEGILRGKRIAINPACGGSDRGSTGRRKLRESTVNIEIAEKLRSLLVSCGAEVIMTRKGEETLSLQERVSRVNRFRAELAVSIHHDAGTDLWNGNLGVSHYPGSVKGEFAAGLVSSLLSPLFPGKRIEVSESAGQFLTHTSSAALEIHLVSLSEEGAEEVLSAPGYQYYVSDRLFSAVLKFFSNNEGPLMPLQVRAVSDGVPLKGSYITVDNLNTLPADADGKVSFSHVAYGEHLFMVQKNGRTLYFGVHTRPACGTGLLIDLEAGMTAGP
jgi:N-acetylmuramoyl-L-alanine amidase